MSLLRTLKKLAGGSEVTMRCRVTLPEEHSPNVKREMGPISMAFVIPMYNLSRLQVCSVYTPHPPTVAIRSSSSPGASLGPICTPRHPLSEDLSQETQFTPLRPLLPSEGPLALERLGRA